MRFVPKFNVRTQLTITFLAVILLSWLLSTATTNLLYLQDMRALRRQMLQHPEWYPRPIAEPELGWRDYILGPQQPFTRGLAQPPPGARRPGTRPPAGITPNNQLPPPNDGAAPPNTVPGGQPGRERPPRADQEAARSTDSANFLLLARLFIAIALALLAGWWLGWRYSRPLAQLEKGAFAYQLGKFNYRIPLTQQDEFGKVGNAMNDMAAHVASQIKLLEDDSRRRRQLLADIAHELRNPVTTLRTMSGALQEGLANEPERQQYALQAMVRTSDRLLHLITDLLQLSRLDLHELPLNCQQVDIRELVRQSMQAHSAAAAAAKITLLSPPTGAPIMIKIDAERISQVIDNILNNAISYAGAGCQVTVTLSVEKTVKLVIKDNGQGIAKQHQPYLFDAFYRVDNARTPGEHNGLGLRIARGLIEAHHGTLDLQSEEGNGTEVIITLPTGG